MSPSPEGPASTAHAGAPAAATPTSSPGPEDAPHRYDAKLANDIELRWQARWAEEGTFHTPNPAGDLADGFERFAGKPKFYVLDMFPYPSGVGLHVGHPLGYIGTDVLARFLRMTGRHVIHPFGYDAFGLPAEQYAVDRGQHPAITTEANIAVMRRQLRRLGLGHDPSRELSTTDPGYYRWTQWIFTQIFNAWFDPDAGRARPIAELVAEFESGARSPQSPENPDGTPWSALSQTERRRVVDSYRLAYVAEAPVNWCPGLGTVLANEEVTSEGRSDVGNFLVFRRPLRQWMLRITAYAERLIDDLALLDWPESIKVMQRNWIGRSDGAEVSFPVDGDPSVSIPVFTTRPDTLFGATYMVVAPEHPLVDQLTASAWPSGIPAAYRGAGLPGAPDLAEGWPTPSDAVAGYRRATSMRSDRQRLAETDKRSGIFLGTYAINPTTGDKIPIFVADYVLMGYGTGAIMAVPAHDQRDFEFARQLGLPIRGVVRPTEAWLARHGLDADEPAANWPEPFVDDGEAMNSANAGVSLDGLPTPEAKRAIVDWLESAGHGKRAVSYRLRDWLFSRQRYWGEPIPIVWDDDGLPTALPDRLLPVELPPIDDFSPQSCPDEEEVEPKPPLSRVPEWGKVVLDLGEGPKTYRRELNTMPQWAGSCWYYLRYLDPTNDQVFVDPEVERYWMQPNGVDLYIGGVEHAVLHLLYARFWHKMLYDLGHVSTPEPFGRLFNQGYIQAAAYTDERGMYVPAAEVTKEPDGSFFWAGHPVRRQYGKMGKSLKNSVSPDDIYQSYGADTLRLYEMAMGPFDADRPWNTRDIIGVHRFLQRVWRNLIDEESGRAVVAEAPTDAETVHLLHRTIAAVRTDLETLRFNTAIARLIELNNHLTQIVQVNGSCPRSVAEPLVLMLAPLAPHIAEELWGRLDHKDSLAYKSFPEANPAFLVEKEVEIPVQIGRKVRFHVQVSADADAEELRQVVMADEQLAHHLKGQTVERVVAVPGKLINVVVR